MYHRPLELPQDCPEKGPDIWSVYFLLARGALLFLIHLVPNVELRPLTSARELVYQLPRLTWLWLQLLLDKEATQFLQCPLS